MEIIEISSDEESKDEVRKENNRLKKRSLSNSASGPGSPPSKRRMTRITALPIEVLDSDDEHLAAMKVVPTKAAIITTRPVKVESGAEKEVAKDKDGRYIVTQKVKVDSIEHLHDVPARWPISPEGTNTAYVIDLNNDKIWQELDPNSKKKYLDRFIKQEVCYKIFMSQETE